MFAGFLGIKFKHHNDGTIEMTQKGLIKKMLATTGMENCNPGNLPAPMDALGSHKDDPPIEEKWNYHAIVGMLLYLATNTRVNLS